MTLLLIFLFGAMAISFLCSLLESVLMSTPISFISAKVEEGDKNAKLMEKMKDDIDRPIAAILSLNTIANTLGAA
jgi:CBS domain containing-hemolysin-like protein